MTKDSNKSSNETLHLAIPIPSVLSERRWTAYSTTLSAACPLSRACLA
jgi:hypothetical protein